MFERFTEKAIKVITDAQNGAKELNHSKLCPEHILLGIVSQKSGIASKFLKAAGLNPQNTKELIKINLKNIETTNVPEILPFSNDLKAVLKKTWDKSVELKTHYILPEHIFLSLLSQEDKAIPKILEELDIDVNRIKTSVERIVENKVCLKKHPEEKSKKSSTESHNPICSAFEGPSSENIISLAFEKLKDTRFEALGTEQLMLAVFEKAGESLI
ncbi:MAG: Clp protease N-terminal domain-containing protein, partial [Candidatus Gastranaerophilaceae bacterium]